MVVVYQQKFVLPLCLAQQCGSSNSQSSKDDEELKVQEVLYEDSVREIRQRQKVEAMLKKQLGESQQLVESISMPGGEIHRLKVLLEEAQLTKHSLTDQLNQLRLDTADQLAEMEENCRQTHRTLQAYKNEAEEIQQGMRQMLQCTASRP